MPAPATVGINLGQTEVSIGFGQKPTPETVGINVLEKEVTIGFGQKP